MRTTAAVAALAGVGLVLSAEARTVHVRFGGAPVAKHALELCEVVVTDAENSVVVLSGAVQSSTAGSGVASLALDVDAEDSEWACATTAAEERPFWNATFSSDVAVDDLGVVLKLRGAMDGVEVFVDELLVGSVQKSTFSREPSSVFLSRSLQAPSFAPTTANPTSFPPEDDISTAAIIGAVGGGIFVISFIFVFIFCCRPKQGISSASNQRSGRVDVESNAAPAPAASSAPALSAAAGAVAGTGAKPGKPQTERQKQQAAVKERKRLARAEIQARKEAKQQAEWEAKRLAKEKNKPQVALATPNRQGFLKDVKFDL